MSRAYANLTQIRSLGQLKTLLIDTYDALIRLRIIKYTASTIEGTKSSTTTTTANNNDNTGNNNSDIKKLVNSSSEPIVPGEKLVNNENNDNLLTTSATPIISNNIIINNDENELEKALTDMAQSGNNEHRNEIVQNKLTEQEKNIVTSRKPILNKTGIECRSRFLIKLIAAASNASSQLLRLEELCSHLLNYPEAKGVLVQDHAIRLVLRLSHKSKDESVRAQSREALSLLGYVNPPSGSGIRILSIDGGGTRGLTAVEMLREIELRTGKRIHELFDLICGVSTGAILTLLLGGLLMPLDQCEVLYRKMSVDIFNQNPWLGTGRLVWNHSYYDTSVWVNLLRTTYGEGTLYEIPRNKANPKIAVMSALMNQPTLQAYMFRSYCLPYQSQSNYNGSSNHKAWEAIRASAAAPGYFEDFCLNGLVHQDGGLLWNNPTALAIHEAKLLWPNEELACVLSLGTGKYIPPEKLVQTSTINLKTKILKILDSATDTEGVHSTLHDLLPPNVYVRLNPYLTELITMDENRPEKLEQLKIDAQMYVRRNEHKVAHAAAILAKPRKTTQKLMDWIQLRKELNL